MIKEAIILAGGLGTRLRSVVSDVPKCMAPVNGIPFIDFIIGYLKHEGIEKFILSLGYKNEIVIDHINSKFPGLAIEFVIENKPLGTGGAIQLACSKIKSDDVIIVNGDTMFNINLAALSAFHYAKQADFSAALKVMKDFSRYGAVETDEHGAIKAFHEKRFYKTGLINGGVYALNIASLLSAGLPEIFSFEKDFLEKYIGNKKFYARSFNNYFIDIGIPEDYDRFKKDYSIILSNHPYNNHDKGNITGDFFEALFELIVD